MKSQDILILLKLISLQQNQPTDLFIESSSMRALSDKVGVSKSEVHAALQRCFANGLAIKDRSLGYPKTNRSALLEFICHGIKYVFPASIGRVVRGMLTGFDAPVLQGHLQSAQQIKTVWPDEQGEVMGQSIIPLFGSAPAAAKQDEQLYYYLALVDAIRLGKPRESQLAQQLLLQAWQ